jgi:hypothetical protein
MEDNLKKNKKNKTPHQKMRNNLNKIKLKTTSKKGGGGRKTTSGGHYFRYFKAQQSPSWMA